MCVCVCVCVFVWECGCVGAHGLAGCGVTMCAAICASGCEEQRMADVVPSVGCKNGNPQEGRLENGGAITQDGKLGKLGSYSPGRKTGETREQFYPGKEIGGPLPGKEIGNHTIC